MGIRTRAGLALVSMLSLAGCGLAINVHYRTEPAGATIESGSDYLGRTAGVRRYFISKEALKNGVHCVLTDTARAKWISGAETVQSEQICAPWGAQGQYDVTRILRRPADAPNLALDLNYANDLAQQDLAERQVAAQEMAANAQVTVANAQLEEAQARRAEAEAELERAKRDKGN
jgi:ParB-like chromosome segregation protein Spo0J